MVESKLFYSKTFIKDLLIIEALRKSDHEAPKTSRQILREVETCWRKLFPNEPLDDSSKKNFIPSTIRKHVRDMNKSGLYKIERHEDNKRGYYNAGQLLTTAEIAIIGAALYRVKSITADEKKILFSKMKRMTDTDGSSIIYSLERQINFDGNIFRANLEKINAVCKAIVEGNKISFEFRHDSITKNSKRVIASPYFIVLRDNEIFLTASVENSATPTDFDLNLMFGIEILSETFQSDKNFSLRQHLNQDSEEKSPLELKISFPESFIEKVVQKFGLNRIKLAAPNGKFADGERQFRATINVSETEGLYQWLRQHCDKVKVNFPDNVRKTLTRQLLRALSSM